VHLLLHLLVPGLVARYGFARNRLRAWLVMVATMAVDLDHLLADPIYDPDRCSLGFHPLHAWALLPVWVLLALWPRTRLVGLGLVIHMGLDGLDCLWMAAARGG
jgi:hypothetical protein